MNLSIPMAALFFVVSCEFNSCLNAHNETRYEWIEDDVVTAIRAIEVDALRSGSYPEDINKVRFLGYEDEQALSSMIYINCKGRYKLALNIKDADKIEKKIDFEGLGLDELISKHRKSELDEYYNNKDCKVSRLEREGFRGDNDLLAKEYDQFIKNIIGMAETHYKQEGRYPKEINNVRLKASFDSVMLRFVDYKSDGKEYKIAIRCKGDIMFNGRYNDEFFRNLGLSNLECI